jgi:hypothetical protein
VSLEVPIDSVRNPNFLDRRLDQAIMAAAIEQIEQDITALRAKAGRLALNAYQTYQHYLAALGRSLPQQLILASYHLCTQAYPQAFLQRSLAQRQALQQALQTLGQQLQSLLREMLLILNQPQENEGLNPDEVLESWEDLETAIVETLQQISRQANQLLQEQDILEIASIETLLEMAAKAAAASRSITSTPHVLKAIIDDKESDDDEAVPVMAIYLQLADLEFIDPEVMSWRHQLRPLWQQLKSVDADFQAKKQEKIVAEAEAAWRASWYPAETRE